MTYSLKLERMIDATPEEVFDAFTDANAQKEWYLDQPGWKVEAGGELRAGGKWEVAFGPAGETPSRACRRRATRRRSAQSRRGVRPGSASHRAANARPIRS